MANLFGTNPNQVPLNSMLGNLAFQDKAYVNVDKVGIGTTFVDSGTAGQILQVYGGGAYVSGSVGIGTTNPSDPLDVLGIVRPRLGIRDSFGNIGAAGSILVSTGAGVSWTNPVVASGGAQGAQGAQGIQGLQGLQGNQGRQGIQGTQGSQGLQGIQGTQGTQGTQGLQGIQGVQGLQGLQGDQGVQGLQGTQGLTGPLPESIVYHPVSISMEPGFGSYSSGTIAGIQTYGDYVNPDGFYGLYDTSTTPGYDVRIGFTGVAQFNRISANINYAGSSTHTVEIDLYNWNTSSWETFQTFSGLGTFTTFQPGVIDSTPFINAGIVSARIYHLSGGFPSHYTQIDYFALEDSIAGGQGPKGAQGTRGAQGLQGPQGLQGTQGTQGIQGSQGLSNQGIQGVQGPPGPPATVSALNYSQTIGSKISVSSSASFPIGIVTTTITTNGNPVQVVVTGDAENVTANTWGRIQLYRDSTAIGNDVQFEGSNASENSPYALSVVDTPPAGTYSYNLKVTQLAGGNFNFGENTGPVIYAYEIANVVGNQGAQGIQGVQGISNQGLQGLQGRQGIQGNQGVQGLSNQGAQGTQGTQGIQGIQGNQGNQGTQGAQGNQGVQGLSNQGAQGTQGNQGLQGTQGNQGLQGTQGNQGIQGLQGPQGNQGAQGLQGTQGNQSTQGAQGAQGTQGNQGVQGLSNQGAQGTQGVQGLSNQGAQGTQGVQGLSNQGAQGNQGVQGLSNQGAQGNQGVQGLSNQGAQGNQGVQGLSNQGAQGNQGVQGLSNQGAQGLQGRQGLQGLSNQGAQGIQGVQGTQGTTGPVAGSANQVVYKDVTNNPTGSSNLTFDGTILYASGLNVTNNVDVGGNLKVTGSITIGGTSTQLNTQQLTVSDPDIVVGLGTTFSPTDATASHGGIAVASTEGNPLVSLNIAGETNPYTYKKIMWFRGSDIGAGVTDAWLINYAVGVGSTQVPNGVRFAVGGIQFTDTTITSGFIDAVPTIKSIIGLGLTNSVTSDDLISIYDNSTGQIYKTTIQNAALQGIQGAQGNQGNQGNQGVQGLSNQGAQGNQGVQGLSNQGAQGNQGVQGLSNQGAQGTQGNQGVQGLSNQGAQGLQGRQGLQGLSNQGAQGTQGLQGAQGNQGVQGLSNQGAQGTQGNQGVQGLSNQGAQGTQGLQGAQGNQGVQGLSNQGAQGNQGVQGLSNQGAQGTQGNQGVQGLSNQGAQGIQGNQGVQGLSNQGAQGTQGNQGVQGLSNQGAQGIQGNQGVQGLSNQGAQGTQGAQGIQGNQGVQGLSNQGAQGNQGVQGLSNQGAQGNQGVQGLSNQGAQGTQGNQGVQGLSNQGAQGNQGVQGLSNQGAQGNQGVQGLSNQGAQGTQSVQGSQGIQGPSGGGTGSGTNYWIETSVGIHTLSNVGIGTTNALYKLTVANNTTPTLSLPNAIADFTSNVAGYSQINIRNTSNNANASSDVVVTADTGTDTINYIDLGINNSNYSSGTWTINGPLDGYLYSVDTNLSIGVVGPTKYLSLFAGGTLITNEIARVTPTGVGIKATSVNASLEVRPSSTSINVGLFTGTTDTDLVRITQDGIGNALRVDDQAGGTTPFIIDNTGKVGINTQTATSNLTVFGSGRITGITTSTYLDGTPIETLRGSILAISYNMSMP